MTLTPAHVAALRLLTAGNATNTQVGAAMRSHLRHKPTSRTKTIFLAQRLMKSLEEVGLARFTVGKGRTYLWQITDKGREHLKG